MVTWWTTWLLLIAVTFALAEGYALHTGTKTLSQFMWMISRQWPPFPWLVGVLVGFLAAHFWWTCQGCPA